MLLKYLSFVSFLLHALQKMNNLRPILNTPKLSNNLQVWAPETISLEVRRPVREADHSPPSSAEVKEWVELYLHSSIRLHGVVLS
jgi:hypothetical protein